LDLDSNSCSSHLNSRTPDLNSCSNPKSNPRTPANPAPLPMNPTEPLNPLNNSMQADSGPCSTSCRQAHTAAVPGSRSPAVDNHNPDTRSLPDPTTGLPTHRTTTMDRGPNPSPNPIRDQVPSRPSRSPVSSQSRSTSIRIRPNQNHPNRHRPIRVLASHVLAIRARPNRFPHGRSNRFQIPIARLRSALRQTSIPKIESR